MSTMRAKPLNRQNMRKQNEPDAKQTYFYAQACGLSLDTNIDPSTTSLETNDVTKALQPKAISKHYTIDHGLSAVEAPPQENHFLTLNERPQLFRILMLEILHHPRTGKVPRILRNSLSLCKLASIFPRNSHPPSTPPRLPM